MAQHDERASQPEQQDSSTEWVPTEEQAPEQEMGRHAGQDESDQSQQDLVPALEAQDEHTDLQEHGGPPQGEIGSPASCGGEPVEPRMDQPNDETPSTSPAELPEQEAMLVPSEPQGAAGK
jgi:hypothetical protein